MKTPGTKWLFFLLIFLNVVILPVLTNVVSALFPVAELSPQARFFLGLAYIVVVLCVIIGTYLFQQISEDPKKIERSAETASVRYKRKFFRPLAFLKRTLEKLAKLFLFWKDAIEKVNLNRARLTLLAAGCVLLLFWFIAKIGIDSAWDDPSEFAQVDYLDTVIGWERKTLTLQLGHFGAEADSQVEPQTYLTRAGYHRDFLLAPSAFTKHLKITPVHIPRNNLSVTLSATDHAADLCDALDSLAQANHIGKILGSFWKPTVYVLELYANTSGNQQEFKRTYHLRERAEAEVWALALSALFLLGFFGSILNLHGTFVRTAAHDRLSGWLEGIFFVVVRIVKIAALLGLPVAQIVEALREIMNHILELIDKLGKDKKQEVKGLVETQMRRIENELAEEGIIRPDKSQKLTKHVVSMFRVIEIIDHKFIIVQEGGADQQAVLDNAKSAAMKADDKGADFMKEYNTHLRRCEEEHSRCLQEILDGVIGDVDQKLRLDKFQNRLENFGNQRELFLLDEDDLFLNPEGEGMSSLKMGIGLRKYREMVQASENKALMLEIRREGSGLLLTEKAATKLEIPAPTPEQPDKKVEYRLHFKPVRLTSPAFKLDDHAEKLICLKPVDAEAIKALYKEKNLIDIKV